MKKSTIWCIVVSCIFMVVGLSLVVVGGAFGGLSYLKETANNRLMNSADIEYSYNYRVGGDYHSVISADGIESLDIEVDKSKVLVMEHESDSIEVTINGDNDVEVHVDGDELQIEQGDGIFGKSCEIVIYIPFNKVFREVSCSVGDGTMALEHIVATEIELEVGTGTLEIEMLESKYLSAEIGAGKGTVEQGLVKDADIEVGMGKFTYGGNISNYMDAECGIGQMTLELEEDEEYYNYSLTSGIGNIKIGDSLYSGISSKRIENDNVDASLVLECGIGQIEISFGNKKSI